MKKIIAALIFTLAAPTLLASCGGGGCDDLKAKLEACGAEVTDCTNDDAAGCTADKLNADCSNLIEAASMCS